VNGRRGRAGQAGAETLELVAALPLLGLVLLLAWQGVALVRQQSQAQADARELARRAALCARAAPPPVLADVDPRAAGRATVTSDAPSATGAVVRVEVRLVPQTVLPGFRLDAGSALAPRAVVVMRREPC
jgi:hypothetical protein